MAFAQTYSAMAAAAAMADGKKSPLTGYSPCSTVKLGAGSTSQGFYGQQGRKSSLSKGGSKSPAKSRGKGSTHMRLYKLGVQQLK